MSDLIVLAALLPVLVVLGSLYVCDRRSREEARRRSTGASRSMGAAAPQPRGAKGPEAPAGPPPGEPPTET